MKAERLLETVLYARDLGAAERFYTDVFGLRVVSHFEDGTVFRCGNGVLIVFDPERTRSEHRGIPAHGADGSVHVAFTMPPTEAEAWKAHLAKKGIDIEAEVMWEAGPSLYVRDPAGNLVELAPPTLWGFDPEEATP